VSDSDSRASSRRHFDVWNEVPMVPQLTGMSCWAAAAAMIVGWRDRVVVSPEEVASGSGRWGAYEEGLLPADVETLARTWELSVEPARDWNVESLRERLEEVGPLWLGEASPGLHSIVVTGIYGDGSPDGTFVRINDPWPVGRGERYLLSLASLMQNLSAASALVGGQGQILHAGGRGHGASRSRHDEQTSRSRVQRTASGAAVVSMSRRQHSSVSYGGVPAGERYLASASLPHDPLASHGAHGDNLFLRWTPIASAADAIDVIVHLHGYSAMNAGRALLEEKVAGGGLDLTRRTGPTLAIVPLGRKITDAEVAAARNAHRRVNPKTYTFPALTHHRGEGLESLVAESLQWLARNVLGMQGGTVAVARFIITAHSGGGDPLNQLLRAPRRRICDPHEVHVFDALYFGNDGLASWAQDRLRRHRRNAPNEGGALRIFYGADTASGSRATITALAGPDLLTGAPAALARKYRAERTGVPHGDIPNHFGPSLLADAGADVPTGAPPSTQAQGLTQGPSSAAPYREQEAERYGIPLGLFRYYSTSRSDSDHRTTADHAMPGRSTLHEPPRFQGS
jgi:hypothetical protein